MKSPIVIRTILVCGLSIASTMAQSPKPATKVSSEWALRGRLIANPHDRDAHKKLCKLLEEQYQFRKCVEERKAWLEDNPSDYFELISLISTAKIGLYDPEYALVAAKQFLANVKPEDDYHAWTNDQIGNLLTERERFSEAIPYLQIATKADPKVSDYWSHLSSAYIGAKQFDKAIGATTKSLDLYPASAAAHIQLGDALAGKGDVASRQRDGV